LQIESLATLPGGLVWHSSGDVTLYLAHTDAQLGGEFGGVQHVSPCPQ
jgi:hypothetical protein